MFVYLFDPLIDHRRRAPLESFGEKLVSILLKVGGIFPIGKVMNGNKAFFSTIFNKYEILSTLLAGQRTSIIGCG